MFQNNFLTLTAFDHAEKKCVTVIRMSWGKNFDLKHYVKLKCGWDVIFCKIYVTFRKCSAPQSQCILLHSFKNKDTLRGEFCNFVNLVSFSKFDNGFHSQNFFIFFIFFAIVEVRFVKAGNKWLDLVQKTSQEFAVVRIVIT